MHQNTITLIGAIDTDILRTTDEDGAAVAVFRLITHHRRRGKDGTWVTGAPTFVTVTCTRRLAQNVAASLHRGDPVIVTGRLRVRPSRDPRLSRVEVEALGVGPDLNRVAVAPLRAPGEAVA